MSSRERTTVVPRTIASSSRATRPRVVGESGALTPASDDERRRLARDALHRQRVLAADVQVELADPERARPRAISLRSASPLRGSTLSRSPDAAGLQVRSERLGQRRARAS